MNNFELLGRHISAMDKAIDSLIEKFNLNYTGFFTLYILALNENNECTQKFIAKECEIPKQSVFNACRELSQKGLITLCESENDKREKIIKLTESGRKQAFFLLHEADKISSRTFKKFGKDKTDRLFELLKELSELYTEEVKKHKFPS